jgi:hypothetical protein
MVWPVAAGLDDRIGKGVPFCATDGRYCLVVFEFTEATSRYIFLLELPVAAVEVGLQFKYLRSIR